VEQIQDRTWHSGALTAIARALARAGRATEAREAAEQARTSSPFPDLAKSREAIIQGFVEGGHIAEAVETARTMERQEGVLYTVAVSLCDAGNAKAALQLAQALRSRRQTSSNGSPRRSSRPRAPEDRTYAARRRSRRRGRKRAPRGIKRHHRRAQPIRITGRTRVAVVRPARLTSGLRSERERTATCLSGPFARRNGWRPYRWARGGRTVFAICALDVDRRHRIQEVIKGGRQSACVVGQLQTGCVSSKIASGCPTGAAFNLATASSLVMTSPKNIMNVLSAAPCSSSVSVALQSEISATL
jgi:hypothetical protein